MTKQRLKTRLRNTLRGMAILTIASLLFLGTVVIPSTSADSLDEQIRALQRENNSRRDSLNALKAQAVSYEDEVEQLQAQINALQASIIENQAKQADLQAKIEESQRELDRQRQTLGADIKAMYIDGQITTIEMLATSKNLSDFVDKEAYRNAVQAKIQQVLVAINALQEQQKAQKLEVETLLAEQRTRRGQLDSSRAEQARLLRMNQQDQNNFNSQIKETNTRIAELQAEQIRLNCAGGRCAAGVPGGGGYQWGDAYCPHKGAADPPCGEYDWGYPNAAYPRNLYDPWNYGYRNCTSWVAFRLSQAGKRGFSSLGNAKQWVNNVPDAWVSHGQGAQVGDAAVSTGGGYGHVRYVERVNPDGTISISDYNRGGDGYYRGPDFAGSTVSQSGLHFIHFPD